MKNRLGVIFIISGFTLLLLRDTDFQSLLGSLLMQCILNWPLFLIVIGFILTSTKKKRKTHR